MYPLLLMMHYHKHNLEIDEALQYSTMKVINKQSNHLQNVIKMNGHRQCIYIT